MSDVSIWVAVPIAVLLVIGASLTLLGCIGLMRFQSFYARIHAPTIGTSFGMIFISVASMLYFTATQSRLVTHEVLLIVFITVTTPATLMLLARAAIYRDRAEKKDGIPPARSLSVQENS